jgi:hypothetical protein
VTGFACADATDKKRGRLIGTALANFKAAPSQQTFKDDFLS